MKIKIRCLYLLGTVVLVSLTSCKEYNYFISVDQNKTAIVKTYPYKEEATSEKIEDVYIYDYTTRTLKKYGDIGGYLRSVDLLNEKMLVVSSTISFVPFIKIIDFEKEGEKIVYVNKFEKLKKSKGFVLSASFISNDSFLVERINAHNKKITLELHSGKKRETIVTYQVQKVDELKHLYFIDSNHGIYYIKNDTLFNYAIETGRSKKVFNGQYIRIYNLLSGGEVLLESDAGTFSLFDFKRNRMVQKIPTFEFRSGIDKVYRDGNDLFFTYLEGSHYLRILAYNIKTSSVEHRYRFSISKYEYGVINNGKILYVKNDRLMEYDLISRKNTNTIRLE